MFAESVQYQRTTPDFRVTQKFVRTYGVWNLFRGNRTWASRGKYKHWEGFKSEEYVFLMKCWFISDLSGQVRFLNKTFADTRGKIEVEKIPRISVVICNSGYPRMESHCEPSLLWSMFYSSCYYDMALFGLLFTPVVLFAPPLLMLLSIHSLYDLLHVSCILCW